MQSLFKHGLKLTFANFLGVLMNIFFSFLLGGVFYFFVFLTVLGTVLGKGAHALSDTEQLNDLIGSVAMIPIIIIFVLYLLAVMVLQSMLIGGLYGSTIESVFENRSSIGTYFTYSFRNLWRLTALQLLIFLLGMPIFIFVLFVNLLVVELFGEGFIPLAIIFSIIIGFLFLTLFLHTPIFIIRLRTKVWKSIGYTFRLLIHNPFRILLSGILFFGTIVLINGLYTLIVVTPAWLGYFFMGGSLSVEALQILLTIYSFLAGGFWLFLVLPFSGIVSLLLLIRHYRQHFHPIVEEIEGGANVYQEEPFFKMKGE